MCLAYYEWESVNTITLITIQHTGVHLVLHVLHTGHQKVLVCIASCHSLLRSAKGNTVPGEGTGHETDMYACYRIIKMTR